uniref:J domain-containing protein n=1 Tax=Theileria parva TaxID=5875 RepID=Q4N4J2_THEPA|eukprot:XP_765214.1 hypothetical protein [Theileria parva strain Muguga]
MEVASLSQNIEEYFDKRNCLASDLNYYEILELDSRCTKEDIRRSYYHFARIFHPDKCNKDEYLFVLNELKAAYDILSDEYKRIIYDIKHVANKKEEPSYEIKKETLENVYDLVRQKYLTFLQEKASMYLNILYYQYKNQGLIIKKAIFGNLNLAKPDTLNPLETIELKHLKGPFIDVTVQLQLLVQNGVLHLNNSTSYAFLPGFYNPIHFNKVHEVTINDKSNLCLPMKSHLVYGNYIKGPFSPNTCTKMY